MTTNSDAGQELSYNRRGRAKVGISWADLENQDAALRVKEVTKQKVYPRPDYEALISAGMPPIMAHLVKQVYDSIASAPKTRLAPTDEELQAYIDGVHRSMDRMIAWAEEPSRFTPWLHKVQRSAQALRSAMGGQAIEVADLAPMAPSMPEVSLLNFVFPQGWKNSQSEVRLLGGNKFLAALQPHVDEALKAVKDISGGWPAKQEAWVKQGFFIVEGTKTKESTYTGPGCTYASLSVDKDRRQFSVVRKKFEGGISDIVHHVAVSQWIAEQKASLIGKFILLNKRGTVVRVCDTQEQAENAAREATKRTGGPVIKEKGISVEAADRQGPSWRDDGSGLERDISSQELLDTFGFKGINFGNWMQGEANAAERQRHLNFIYDSFMDLSQALGVQPSAMSMGGLLGVAVGAQGSGHHAAHFVPGVNEINLTRESGAGSLAHEWGHALDHYLARQATLVRTEEPFLSEHATSNPVTRRHVRIDGELVLQETATFGHEISPELVTAMAALKTSMRKRPATEEEMATRDAQANERYMRNIKGWLASIRGDFSTAIQVQMVRAARQISSEGFASDLQQSEHLRRFDELAARIESLQVGPDRVSVSRNSFESLCPEVADLRSLYKTITGRIYPLDNVKALQTNLDVALFARNNPQTPAEESHTRSTTRVDTEFYKAALQMDREKGGKPYWSTPREMFARAFDAFVSDQLEAAGQSNTYLSHTGRSGATVPNGDERKVIGQAIDNLVQAIRSDAHTVFESMDNETGTKQTYRDRTQHAA